MKYTVLIFAALLALLATTAQAQYYRPHPGQGSGGHNNGQYGYGQGQLSSTPLQCFGAQGLCNTNVSWNVGYGRTGLVTVTVTTAADPNERQERIMSCGEYGTTYVPWIRSHDTYLFKLYETSSCSYIPYGSRVLDQIVVRR